jgi:hypothetical protein
LVVSNTAGDVPAGLSPSRYRIEALKVTATLIGTLIFEPLGFILSYDNTLDDFAALTTPGGDTDPGRPIEMYGIGFQGDYQTVSFAAEEATPDSFRLGDKRWVTYQPGDPQYDPENPSKLSPYQFFAIDAQGRDVGNSVFGGYSATEPQHTTAQFTPEPFAIGKVFQAPGVEKEPGTLLASGDQFVFEPDLSDQGIVAYIQNSLARGFLGFSFSSLHEPAGHLGTVPYPDFYLDDLDVGPNPNGQAPRIELAVTILAASFPGDFNGDSVVRGDDLLIWQRQFGNPASPAGDGADGNGDGLVDSADLALWTEHFGQFANSSANLLGVPEPTTAALIAIVASSALTTRGPVRELRRRGGIG